MEHITETHAIFGFAFVVVPMTMTMGTIKNSFAFYGIPFRCVLVLVMCMCGWDVAALFHRLLTPETLYEEKKKKEKNKKMNYFIFLSLNFLRRFPAPSLFSLWHVVCQYLHSFITSSS